jgi:hypothetical protein
MNTTIYLTQATTDLLSGELEVDVALRRNILPIYFIPFSERVRVCDLYGITELPAKAILYLHDFYIPGVVACCPVCQFDAPTLGVTVDSAVEATENPVRGEPTIIQIVVVYVVATRSLEIPAVLYRS